MEHRTSERDVRVAIVGDGRMGRALVTGLAPGVEVAGPFGRGFDGTDARDPRPFDAVLLAVPDGQIATAAACIAPGSMIGHCAGSLGLDVLHEDGLGERECFAIHPLMTVTAAGALFAGAGAAIAGSTPRAVAFARRLADVLGMHTFEIADADRAAYHAAASIASNFLVTIEDAAETLLATAGAQRSVLVPLVRAAVESWADLGGQGALTGPISRGDDATVARQRAAVAERTPELLALFDALTIATRAVAARRG